MFRGPSLNLFDITTHMIRNVSAGQSQKLNVLTVTIKMVRYKLIPLQVTNHKEERIGRRSYSASNNYTSWSCVCTRYQFIDSSILLHFWVNPWEDLLSFTSICHTKTASKNFKFQLKTLFLIIFVPPVIEREMYKFLPMCFKIKKKKIFSSDWSLYYIGTKYVPT